MKKNKAITIIEFPAQILLAIFCALKIFVQAYYEMLPFQDYVSSVQKVLIENKDMYSWWIKRWVTPASILFYIVLFTSIL